ncbi:hypothetical protein JH06_4384 [Blastocystis sp. subtype 4]|uniref:hypothetical protein n=1 Tax=Blastocystis sp. subtype 4 TaxID=944170 RepID=UPI0007117F7B|nr:hypothetical protein JH06_4384 [Blastocystis sp. subtype 4]KNB42208.1 hypothetical protein JH06_4384 [Blastocystis sp. subtype 4]|eukprot:XP_014525651.1 hypothetical protein JH06_4384 [Blastocystis sp. subtype 4]
MSDKIIDGKKVAEDIHAECLAETTKMMEETGKVPGLAVILVGERRDSQTYVRNKKRMCVKDGIKPFDYTFPADISEDELLKVVEELNANPEVHGILVQLPLPNHINEERILNAISIEKDVDGFHPLNIGKLSMKGRTPLFVPCTPKGCIELLDRYHVEIAGKNAVVIGRSNIVGIPVAMLLLGRNATVTICHSHTKNLKEHLMNADIIVAAVGVANLVKGDMIKEGCVIIDVGMNAVDDPNDKRGYHLCGDVDYQSCYEKCRLITPVPGGVGPMTIAMLMKNTVESGKRAIYKN